VATTINRCAMTASHSAPARRRAHKAPRNTNRRRLRVRTVTWRPTECLDNPGNRRADRRRWIPDRVQTGRTAEGTDHQRQGQHAHQRRDPQPWVLLLRDEPGGAPAPSGEVDDCRLVEFFCPRIRDPSSKFLPAAPPPRQTHAAGHRRPKATPMTRQPNVCRASRGVHAPEGWLSRPGRDRRTTGHAAALRSCGASG
jgi:hypothetical protein